VSVEAITSSSFFLPFFLAFFALAFLTQDAFFEDFFADHHGGGVDRTVLAPRRVCTPQRCPGGE
jgi:hypothetical protein